MDLQRYGYLRHAGKCKGGRWKSVNNVYMSLLVYSFGTTRMYTYITYVLSYVQSRLFQRPCMFISKVANCAERKANFLMSSNFLFLSFETRVSLAVFLYKSKVALI